MKIIVGDFTADGFPTEEEMKNVCRRGKGADTCVWLVYSKGFQCAYYNRPFGLMEAVESGTMVAKRNGCEQIKNVNFDKGGEQEFDLMQSTRKETDNE